MATSECLDEIQIPLNACSLEVWGSALVVGCYQLNEASSPDGEAGRATEEQDESESSNHDKGTTNDGGDGDGDADGKDKAAAKATRSGELHLYSVSTPSPTSMSPKFGEPAQVLPMESGVLDAKWCPSAAKAGYLASACASGSIHVHRLTENGGDYKRDDNRQLEHVASSLIRSEDCHITRLALSLDWEKRSAMVDDDAASDADALSRKIVSSYSDGTLSIHTFHSDNTSLAEEERWDGHALFGCPSEVWTCCFAASASTGHSALSNDGTGVVLSGGDDCTLKLWDVRTQLSRPMAKVGTTEFDAGVTAVSYHPTVDHLLAVGSYDEVVRLYDVRNWKDPLSRINVGGGVWRIRWHPTVEGRMLVGAMHGGCRIVALDGLAGRTAAGESDGALEARIESEFTKHESMAYGADWLVGKGGGGDDDDDCNNNGGGSGSSSSSSSSSSSVIEYAASCSFYDRRVCLWRSAKTA